MANVQGNFYESRDWRAVRERALSRDDGRCTVARLLGGACSQASPHVHHIEPRTLRPDLALDLDNLATVCASHHPTWEAVRRHIERSRQPLPPCRHTHRYKAGLIECRRKRAKRLGIVLDEAGLAAA